MMAVAVAVVISSRGKANSRVSNPKAPPPSQLRELLVSARRGGLDFETAWEVSWRQLRWPHDTTTRRAWKIQLEEERGIWQAAYERQSPEVIKAGRALAALMSMVEQLPERAAA